MLTLILSLVLAGAQLALPRRLAFIPLLIALFHLGNASLLSEFTPMRLVILTGLMRALAGGFLSWSFGNRLDQFVMVFCGVALLSTVGHEGNEYVRSPLIERGGLVLNVLSSYLYARAYFSGPDFVVTFAQWLAIVLIPFSTMMALEQATGRNPYFLLGARSENTSIRNDRFRAKGPFGHAILAGTAAAAALPFMVLLLRHRKGLGAAGIAASVVGSVATVSSGPVVAMGCAMGLLLLWRWRHLLGRMKACAGLLLIVLNFTMSRPIWFLIARIDIVGGSTGWHRSKLIDTAMNNLDEWWLFGTDYTRHWMHSGVTWNPNHTDITNYYLQMGVTGGLPLMVAFLAIIITALRVLEKSMVVLRAAGDEREFHAWCLWTGILTHCVSFISISYFDQSYAGFFLLVGAAPAIAAWVSEAAPTAGDLPSAAEPNSHRPDLVAPHRGAYP